MNLAQRLRAGRARSNWYQGGLSNHLPMALISLDRLGAGADRLEVFEKNYVGRLERKGENERARTDALFERLVDDDAVEAALSEHIDAVGSGAFHALIRFAFGLEVDARGELADALVGWRDERLDLGQPDAVDDDARAILARVPAIAASGPSIHHRMGLVTKDAGFVRDTPQQLTLDGLRKLAREIYAGTHDDFTALHLVTGAQALAVVVERFPALEARALRSFWVAALAAWITIDRPAPAPCPTSHTPWAALKARAIQSHNDHTIKLVYACSREAERSHDLEYRGLAERKLDR